jgi:hypothetical protein
MQSTHVIKLFSNNIHALDPRQLPSVRNRILPIGPKFRDGLSGLGMRVDECLYCTLHLCTARLGH